MSHLILPVTEPDTVAVSYEEMRRIAAASDVLEKWGYQITCPMCARLFGYGKDGVEGNNEPGASVLVVRCGCTVRRCEMRGN